MKRKILFIVGNLGEGGVSKSMVNLLNIIDRERYDISLYVGHGGGMLAPLVPADTRTICDWRTEALLDGFGGIWRLIRGFDIYRAFGSGIRMALSVVSKSMAGRLLARLMPRLDESFDVAVDYNGQHQLYWMVKKIKARRKYTFFHSDYEKWPFYYAADKKYMPEADGIFTISDKCADSLKKYFPAEAGKVDIIPNLSSSALIRTLAKEAAPEMTGTDVYKLISVGHLSHLKGTDMAIHAAAILKKHNVRFHWYFIGKPSGDADYKELAKNLDVADCITFLGLKLNPYAYINKADIFVHASLFEGKSIALDEAKILAKPVVVTNFSTVNDQFENRVNASIVEMTPEAIAAGIIGLIENADLREVYKSNLASENYDKGADILKFYKYLDR